VVDGITNEDLTLCLGWTASMDRDCQRSDRFRSHEAENLSSRRPAWACKSQEVDWRTVRKAKSWDLRKRA
jgi:hypothetical protein